ncbi:MAG TPA: hypothetical protein VGW38_29785, partial [Chloroflexota bacterium]|nr:hypothetical protein [Chloroflexota bacterium]
MERSIQPEENPEAVEPFVFNGINGRTGNYLLEPKLPEEVSAYARGAPLDETQLNELKWRYRQATEQHLGVRAGIDPTKLEEAGWGVIFAHDADPAIKQALAPLLELRKEQATSQKPGRYKEFTGPAGPRPVDSKNQFLAR